MGWERTETAPPGLEGKRVVRGQDGNWYTQGMS